MARRCRPSASRKPRGLRAAFTALALALIAHSVAAADLDDSILRGSFSPQSATPSYSNWSGVYFGGQLGASSSTVDYSNSLNPLVDFILRESVLESTVSGWPILGKESVTHIHYGGFIGYNFYQWDQVVLGIEANYNRVDLDSAMQDSLTRIIPNDTGAPTGHHYFYTTTVDGSASVHVTDVATLRARAGWSTGQFLPYIFGGLALGRVNYHRSATVSYTTEDKVDPANPPLTPDPPPGFPPVTKSEAQSNAYAYGATAGLGLEVSVLPNMFVRAEWEYILFAPIHDIQVNMNSARVGLGLKF